MCTLQLNKNCSLENGMQLRRDAKSVSIAEMKLLTAFQNLCSQDCRNKNIDYVTI